MIPPTPKLYHIVHVDRLPSILAAGCLWCDAETARQGVGGPVIGINHIKQRRLEHGLTSHPGLRVGECVPFYFCPRSVMLYIIHKANHSDIAYRDGQGPIIHLEADLRKAIDWAVANRMRWAFTLGNAGSKQFEDRADIQSLCEIDWDAVHARNWSNPDTKEGKQAEFLMERSFPWGLVERIGVLLEPVYRQVANSLPAQGHRPQVEVKTDWYY